MNNAEYLIERITNSPKQERVGVLANELLREFHRGYPLEKLLPMLFSNDDDVVSIGIWILSEMGERCRPLLGAAMGLLSHPAKRVRFWAVDCLFWEQVSDGRAQAAIVKLLDDPEGAVRWKVMDIMSHFSKEQLRAAFDYFSEDTQSLHTSRLRWLLSGDSSIAAEVIKTLQSNDSLVRKYGAVAAARMRDQDTNPLIYASSIKDSEVSGFAATRLK